jgi:hypothetical protein
MWNNLRRHLIVKLLISYLVVILVGTLVQAIATEIVTSGAYQRLMTGME